MEIIAISSIKGGVGKTTTAVNLAYLSAAAGWRTLIWDLDPQGGTTYLLGNDAVLSASAKDLARDRIEPNELIVETPYERLDLLPGDMSLRRMDVHLSERKHPTERLLKMSRDGSGAAAFLLDGRPTSPTPSGHHRGGPAALPSVAEN